MRCKWLKIKYVYLLTFIWSDNKTSLPLRIVSIKFDVYVRTK